MELIAQQILSSATASVSFSSVPQTFRDLFLVIVAQSDTGSTTTAINMSLNSDTTNSNYQYVLMQGNGSTAVGSTSADRGIGAVPDDGMTIIYLHLLEYRTSKHKTYLSRSNNPNMWTRAMTHRWINTSAVTSITLTPFAGNFRTNSTFTLYGIAG